MARPTNVYLWTQRQLDQWAKTHYVGTDGHIHEIPKGKK
jgi:hypothetical protein